MSKLHERQRPDEQLHNRPSGATPLTDESEELIDDLEHQMGTKGVLRAITQLHDIERAAAERAREGHIREFLESESFKDDLMRALHQNAPLGHPPTQFVRSICSFAGSHRADADEIAEWLLARHPEAAS